MLFHNFSLKDLMWYTIYTYSHQVMYWFSCCLFCKSLIINGITAKWKREYIVMDVKITIEFCIDKVHVPVYIFISSCQGRKEIRFHSSGSLPHIELTKWSPIIHLDIVILERQYQFKGALSVTILNPGGLVHWTQVLMLSECGFESQPGRSRCLCPWARHLTIIASSFTWDVKLEVSCVV